MQMEETINQYSNMLFKMCLVLLCCEADAQDAVQETFCKYWICNKKFVDKEHEKAWLIRVAINKCKDIKRFQKRNPVIDITELSDYYKTEQQGEMLKELLNLPDNLKIVLNLFYIDGYHINEIAAILHISENAVKKRLQRGRTSLKNNLKGMGES